MVNTQYLEELISKSGKKKTYLADKCGCSVQTLRRKIQNDAIFNSDQIEALCIELNVTKLSEKERIFFTPKVDK